MLWLYLVLVVFPASLYTLLRSNAVQNIIAQGIATYLSSELKTRVSVGGVDIAFFLDVVLEDVRIDDLHGNILLKARRLVLDVGDIHLKDHVLNVDELTLDNGLVALKQYKGEHALNLQFIIDNYTSRDTVTTSGGTPWKLAVTGLNITDSRFTYRNFEKDTLARGIDFDNLDIHNLNLKISDVTISGDTINAQIKNISLAERGGFVLNSMSTLASVSSKGIRTTGLKIKTPFTNLDLDLAFEYNEWDDFNDFVNKVNMVSTIRASVVNTCDIAFFVPEMWGMNNKIKLIAEVRGKVKNLKGRKMKLMYGRSTWFEGDIATNGLPLIEETYIHASVHRASTSKSDLERFLIPGTGGTATHLNLPPEFAKLGNVSVTGFFTGFVGDFVAKADFITDIGKITTDLKLQGGMKNSLLGYSGRLVTKDFDLGTLLNGQGGLGKVSINAAIDGKGISAETADLSLTGTVSRLDFNQYSYTGIALNATLAKKIFNGHLTVNDPNLVTNFDGGVDFTDTIPAFDFISRVTYANMKVLKWIKTDSISDVSGSLNFNFKGNTIDNLQGSASITNANYKEGKNVFYLSKLELDTHRDTTGYRTFNLKSDYVDAWFKGFFEFKEIPASAYKFISAYLPGIKLNRDSLEKIKAKQLFEFDITFYNATPVAKYFVPGLSLAADTKLFGSFNSEQNSMAVQGRSKAISLNGIELLNLEFRAETQHNYITANLLSDTLKLSDSTWIHNVRMNAFVSNDSIKSQLLWNNNRFEDRNSGDIKAYALIHENAGMTIGLANSQVVVDDSLWLISSGSRILIDSSRFEFRDVRLECNRQKLAVNGVLSKNPQDSLNLSFNSFNLSDFDFLSNAYDFDLDGTVTGTASLLDVYTAPTYFADLNITGLGFNGSRLGDAVVKSNWDDINKGISIDAQVLNRGDIGTIKPLIAKGYYFPLSKKNNFDLNIFVEKLDLRALSRYLGETASIINGNATGSLTLTGTNANPVLEGRLKLWRTFFKINYLNTIYSCAPEDVQILKNEIRFDSMLVLDQPYADSAWVNGKVMHDNFKNFRFDINIQPRSLMCMNTNAALNELFYGKAFASGNARIYGDAKNINMDIHAKTEKGTQLFIPMSSTSSVSENKYIHFRNAGTAINDVNGAIDLSGIQMNFAFDVTDDAEVQIMFDPQVGDRIRGRGNGNIQMEINTNGSFKMYGDYTIKSGDYLFTFENVINKRFDILQGGTIRWNGDPYDADLDVKAIYRVKAGLAGLGVDTNSRSVPVECIINMSGKLVNPTFSFEIDFPSLSDFEKSPYLAEVNRNLSSNFLTLLVLNSFYSSGVTGTNAQGSGTGFLGKSTTEVLSNQMSNWLSQISKDVDIGVNYRPGDQITREEVEVALRTQLFNDKVTIESNLGVGGGSANSATQNSNTIVGDVNVEVKITDKVKLSVFNRSNQNDYLSNNAPYTQGVGVFYRREFNTFKELFQRKKKKNQ
ncbi:MAG: translocation/assembly module TamB domain-containing protein [Bacteroidota bacterium]